jgi:site-specific recombinase XerD
MCWKQEKFEEAITCKEKSLQLWSKILVNNHPNLISNKKEIAMMKEFFDYLIDNHLKQR